MNYIKNFFLFFNEEPIGRTIQRTVKTFVYSCLAFYITNKLAPFSVDWVAMIEVGLLASLGFGIDKGVRELKK